MSSELLNIRQDESCQVENCHMACFVDILGMRERLELAGGDIEQLTEIHSLLKEFYSHFNGYMRQKTPSFSSPQINLFSDCAYLSVPAFSERSYLAHSPYDYYGIIINGLAFAQAYMLFHRNIFIRGGISFGACVYSENVEVSSAYYNAYKIESCFAKNPIIAVHGLSSEEFETLPGLNHYGGERNVGNSNEDTIIDINLCKFNGSKLYMLDYLLQYMIEVDGFANEERFIEVINDHKKSIMAAYRSIDKESVRAKYRWLGMIYHNYFVNKYATNRVDFLCKDSDFYA